MSLKAASLPFCINNPYQTRVKESWQDDYLLEKIYSRKLSIPQKSIHLKGDVPKTFISKHTSIRFYIFVLVFQLHCTHTAGLEFAALDPIAQSLQNTWHNSETSRTQKLEQDALAWLCTLQEHPFRWWLGRIYCNSLEKPVICTRNWKDYFIRLAEKPREAQPTGWHNVCTEDWLHWLHKTNVNGMQNTQLWEESPAQKKTNFSFWTGHLPFEMKG